MKLLIFCIGLIAFLSCQPRQKFDDWELAWLNVYNQDDTLIFESSNHDIDTTFIEKRDIFYQENEGTVLLYGVIWYRNSALKYHSEGAKMISLVKNELNGSSFYVNYLYAGFLVADFNEENMKKRMKNQNVYMFNTFRNEGHSDLPKALFWDTSKGLVEYVTHDDVVWKRVN